MTTVAAVIAIFSLLLAAAWLGRRAGRTLRRCVGVALAILGVGVVLDPPARHGLESVGDERDSGQKGAGDGPDS